jgi:hypothetical protein
MPIANDDIRLTDSKGRLTLPKGFANATVLVQVVSDVELVIRKAKVVPLTEAGDDDELPPFPHVRPLSDRDRDMLLAALENPPEPNEALRKLMSQAPPPAGEPPTRRLDL